MGMARRGMAMCAAALLAASLAGGVPPAFAQQSAEPELLAAPLQNDFRGELSKLQGSLERLNGRIAESAKEIDRLTDPKSARAQIEQMQAAVAEVLAAVADNGKVSELGSKALGFADTKLKQLGDSKFSGDERKTLLEGWQKIQADLQGEVNALGSVRRELSGLLRTIQSRGDFFAELQALDDGKRMLSVVRELADEMRRSTESLRGALRSTGQPGS